MARMVVTKLIDAPIEVVFRTVADIHEFRKVIPDIMDVEFLSEIHSGVGTRFRETRLMKGKEAATELEVTEYVRDERVRLVSDSHGAIWDTVFTVAEKDGKVELVMTMDATARKLVAKMMIPMAMGMIKKAVEKDMDAVKAYCER